MNYKGWEITLDNSRGCGYQNAVRATLRMGEELITHYWENFCDCIHYLRAVSDNREHIEQFKRIAELMTKNDKIVSIVERVDYDELVEQGCFTLMCELTGDNDVQLEFDNGNEIFRMRVLVDGIEYTEWRRFAWTGERDADLQYAVGKVLADCEEELINYINGRAIE